MGLHMVESQAGSPGKRREGPYLIEDVVTDILRGRVDAPAPKAKKVGETRMGTHGNSVLTRPGQGLPNDPGVAGVETAGHVCGRDDAHHHVVGAALPKTEALAQVGVEVHARHTRFPPRGRPFPTAFGPEKRCADGSAIVAPTGRSLEDSLPTQGGTKPGSTDPRRRLGAQAHRLAARRLRSSFTQLL